MRSEKQSYLRTQIIDKGYCPEEFTKFCEDRKGNDVDNWTLEELKAVVEQFKNQDDVLSVDEEDLTPEVIEPLNISEAVQHALSDSNPDQFIQAQAHSPLESQEVYSVPCQVSFDNSLSLQESLEVSITGTEVVPGSLFSSTKVKFQIETFPMKWKVTRSMDDFVWVKWMLCQRYPGHYTPPIPPKKIRYSVSEDLRKQQVMFLQKFLGGVMRNALFQKCPYIVSFLQEEEGRFASIKKAAAKEKKVSGLSDLWSLTGQVKCDPTFDLQTEKERITYVNTCAVLKKRLKKQTETLISKLLEVTEVIAGINESFSSLERLQNYFPELTCNKVLYKSLQDSFQGWSTQNLKATQALQNHFRNFFKYEEMEMSNLKSMTKERNNKYAVYIKSEQSNKKLQEAKDEFAYFNYQLKKEVPRVLNDIQNIQNLHFIQFAKTFTGIQETTCLVWQELLEALTQARNSYLKF